MTAPFVPNLKWHAKVFLVILLFCVAAFFCLSCLVSHLPQPYQKRVPAAETTPWLN
ncbi:MAG: hypothetical protein J6U96_04265 [Elusimicrobiaceae bacterium]|nr:hypothetical protein [Elusimicrobiaceae bacterium]